MYATENGRLKQRTKRKVNFKPHNFFTFAVPLKPFEKRNTKIFELWRWRFSLPTASVGTSTVFAPAWKPSMAGLWSTEGAKKEGTSCPYLTKSVTNCKQAVILWWHVFAYFTKWPLLAKASGMSGAKRYTLNKSERLTNKKLISRLFDSKEYDGIVKSYPFIITWQKADLGTNFPAQILFVISKKFSRKAVDRKRVRRQMREIHRCHKHQLYDFLEQRNLQIALALIFTGKQHFNYWFLDEKYQSLLAYLQNDIDQKLQDPAFRDA